MPTTLVAPLLLLLGMGVFSGRQDGVQSRGDSIRYSLTAEEAYRADQPIPIGFTFENVSRAELWILHVNTPLEGLRGRIFSVSCGGIDIPYLGPVVKRGDPTIREYHHLPPGEQTTEAVELIAWLRLFQMPVATIARSHSKGFSMTSLATGPNCRERARCT